ncbi:MAG: transcription-repair coupling factor [Planctomycetaceae bacterium]|nr:transcription-repair coupling factor [Planctomycetaceae bacterium]
MLDLTRSLASQTDFMDTVATIQEGMGASIDGVWGSSCALVSAAISAAGFPVNLIVLPRGKQIDDFCDDLRLFTEQEVFAFPVLESGSSRESYGNDDQHGERIRILKRLLEYDQREVKPCSIVTSIQALLQPVPTRESLVAATRSLQVGDVLELASLQTWLVENGFHATSAVELPGEFSRRGGILDIYAPEWEQPARLEFWDQELESIRRFDVRTQRSIESLTRIELTSIQSYYRGEDHLANYLPQGSSVTIAEMADLDIQAREYLKLASDFQRCHQIGEVIQSLTEGGYVLLSALAVGELQHDLKLAFESVDRFSGDVDSIALQVERIGNDRQVVIVCPTQAEIRRMQEILQDTRAADRDRIRYELGYLKQGFHWVSEKTVVLSVGELFRRTQLRRRQLRQKGKPLNSFTELKNGELVVHLAHGIGRYRGIELLEKEGYLEEHLVVEFYGNTRIFVPATRIDLVQKYIGGRKVRPALARIGGKTWQNQKQAAAKAVEDMAAELVELQATRMARPGITFQLDSLWQNEFDASFPYDETADQLDSISQIKDDMQSTRPMDRLLCGDVGFGKTEVAMRAAFKAVDSGYQVAVLVPTTVLAEQHYQTFKTRMAQFPIDVARLSRFVSATQQRETVAGIHSGRIDVVIGTHRIASKDVKFQNLGLVIIDEEQRFGVEIKERLKNVSNNVDVLTLSATPIPRTLHMSLVGVRDISNLLTAPEERLPVETRVLRSQDEIIKAAIHREMNRGGQIYFVHNRVNDIHRIAAKLRELVPEARIEVGHGQMKESELERVMVGFINHEFDILLATTIVESGLDIPNANTIFIDQADLYGLADLHQLRGRVGRYKHRAYCYLLVDQHKHITPDAARRLRSIEEYSEMGAGFAIAMRDLEIRGAGNLLGSQQSGHIATVGYEFYCSLLENAVRQIKKQPPKLAIDVEIDLPVDAFLPEDYVTDIRAKIDFYRRLSKLEDFEEIHQLKEELIDRFGRPPQSVEQLLQLAEVRLEAAIWQITSISLEDRFLRIQYVNRQRIEQLARNTDGAFRIVDNKSAYLTLPAGLNSDHGMITFVKSVLHPAGFSS